MADSLETLTIYNHNEKGNPHPQYSNVGIRSANYTDSSPNAYLPIFDFKMDNNESKGSMYRIYGGFKAIDEYSDNNHGILNVSFTHTVDYSGKLINLVGTGWDIYDPNMGPNNPFEYLVFYKDLGNNIYEIKSYLHLTGRYKKLSIISPWIYVPAHVSHVDQREFFPKNSRITPEDLTAYFFDPINSRNLIDDGTFTAQTVGFTKVVNQQEGSKSS